MLKSIDAILMKRLLFSTIFSLSSLLFFAQQISIKATVYDETNKQPMSFVGASLLKGDSLINGTMANDKGVFLLENVGIGTYQLKVTFLGYEPKILTLNLSGKNTNVNLGPIYLKEDSKMLKDVEIVAQGTQMKFEVDKKVFSVDQNIASAGGSVTEVLENVPSVEVDPEGNISLRNSTNVEVWINGKPAGLTEENRAQILEQMPAGSVESIEVITNPSAKYSPEGTAGIINLVLKKDRKAGYFGNATAGIILPARSKMGQLAGINFNYNKGKVDAYLNVGFRNWWHIHEGITDRYYFSGADTSSSLYQTIDNSLNRMGANGRFGLTYHINDKHSIGISGFGITGEGSNEELVGYDFRDSVNAVVSDYDRDIYETGLRNSGNATLDYAWLIDKKGSELRSSLSYAFFQIERDANYLQTVNAGSAFPLDQIQNLDASNNSLHFKTDFVKKYSENSKLETGVDIKKQIRESYSDGANKIGADYIDVPSMYNSYDYEEQIYGYYATFGTKIKKFRMMGGIRGEYTLVNTNSISELENISNLKEDFQFYPSAFFAYNISKKDELQFNYTRRIDRPRGRRLNPYHDYSDSTNISYGNPYLKPEFTSAFELNYVKTFGKNDKSMLSTSLYSRYTDNVIQRVRFINDGVLNSTYINITQSQSSGVEIISKNSIAKFLNLTTTVNMFYYYLKPSAYEFSPSQTVNIDGNESFSWDARVLMNIMLSKTFAGQITGKYASPKATPQGETRSNFILDIGMRKSLFNKLVNVSLAVRDVLNSRTRITDTYGTDFSQYDEFANVGPNVTLSVTYNFGNGDKKKAKNKQDEDGNNDQEMEDF